MEDGPEGAGDLPRQLQGRPAPQRCARVRERSRRGDSPDTALLADGTVPPIRRRLPKQRSGQTISFAVGGAEGYLTSSSYPDDGLGEIFLKMSKQGSTLAGMMDAFSIAVSIGLQYGVPLEQFVRKFINMRFEPAGLTDDPDIRMATSFMDYIFRRLALDYLPLDARAELGIHSVAERLSSVADVDTVTGADEPVAHVESTTGSSTGLPHRQGEHGMHTDAPMCFTCGTRMRPAGSCFVCEGCGVTSGCS